MAKRRLDVTPKELSRRGVEVLIDQGLVLTISPTEEKVQIIVSCPNTCVEGSNRPEKGLDPQDGPKDITESSMASAPAGSQNEARGPGRPRKTDQEKAQAAIVRQTRKLRNINPDAGQ